MADATTGFAATLADAVAARTEAFAEAIDRARQGDAASVHRARTTSRRLRELLPVAAVARPDVGAARARREVRRLTRALGAVREFDVSLAELESAADRRPWHPAAVAAIARHIAAERDRGFRKLQSKLSEVDSVELIGRLQAVAEGVRSDPMPLLAERALARRLRRRATRLRAAIDAAGTVYVPARLHKVRIAAKKLRYGLEVAHDAAGLPVGALLAALKRAQDLLGQLHDLQVLEAHVREAAETQPDRAVARRERTIAAALEREAREQHAAFLAQREALAHLARRVDEVAGALAGRRPRVLKAGSATLRSGRARRKRGV